MSKHTLSSTLDQRSPRAIALDLLVISFAGLFLELFLIRHLGTELRVMAYFQNSVLIACFVGLGLGFRYARKPLRYELFIPLLAIFFAAVLTVLATGLAHEVGNPSGGELLWGPPPTARGDVFFYTLFVVVFACVIGLFMMLGQITGALFVRLPTLPAYCWNIGGSLAGVLAFTTCSFVGMPPVGWLVVAFGASIIVLRGRRRALLVGGLAAIATVALYTAVDTRLHGTGEIHWTPYQKVVTQPLVQKLRDGTEIQLGMDVGVNLDYHQTALDLSDAQLQKYGRVSRVLRNFRAIYDFPYTMHPAPKRVLVLGAGTGNDVAAALRNGAEHVDAIEIDPVIARLGRARHPERPYDDPRVTLIVDDARAYLRRTDQRYDFIVYGLLDSHTQVSGMVQVRLENFVYTVEGLQEARSRLTEQGMVALSFAADADKDWLPGRFRAMFAEAFDEEPLAINSRLGRAAVFLAGPGLDPSRLRSGPFTPIVFDKAAEGVEPARDDWPFLYLRERGIPVTYAALIGVIALLFFGIYRTTDLRSYPFSPHFFFLGAAFLLVEVKGITELALVFGTTWVVNAIAISSVLLLILGANLWLIRRPRSTLGPYYAGLWATLAIGYLIPASLYTGLPLWGQQIASVVLLFLPVFFAAVIFATSLDRTKDVEGAFASNLIGAMVGGFLEYSSLVGGIKVLYVVALLLYIASAWGILYGKKSRLVAGV